MAVGLQHALRLSQEAFADTLGVSARTVAKWQENPEAELRPATQEILDTALARADESVRQRFALLMDGLRSTPGALATPSGADMAEALISAASESSADALLRAGHLGAEAMPELVQHIMQVALSYNTDSRMTAFRHARATRDVAIRLADHTRRPNELADLYVTIGQANSLMASLAFDLGKWDATGPMARAAATYAEMAGHASLGAWALGLEATLAFWREDVSAALKCVDAGLAIAPRGAPRFRLHHIAARAHAVAGNAIGIRDELNAAAHDREIAEHRRDDLQDVVAGEFRFDDARAFACAGAAWLRVGDGEAAVEYTQRTLDAYETDSAIVPVGLLRGAEIDTGAALLLRGDLDDAEAHVTSALALPPDSGNVSLGGRLANVRQLLNAPAWKGNRAARDLADEVDHWLRRSYLAARDIE